MPVLNSHSLMALLLSPQDLTRVEHTMAVEIIVRSAKANYTFSITLCHLCISASDMFSFGNFYALYVILLALKMLNYCNDSNLGPWLFNL